VFTPDDQVTSSSVTYLQARPNVIYELGWFCGKLGRSQAMLLLKEGTTLFSDFGGIMQKRALLINRLDDAQKCLEEAITLQPGDDDAKVMLAEAFYRRDDFQKAAAALSGVEVSTNKLIISQYPTLNVAKLQSFKGQTPYEVHGDGQTTRLKFLNTSPLPLVSVRVNGGDEVTFFIDTGGSEVALDTDFAKELGVPHFGEVQGTFSGGQHAEVQQGRIESLTSATGR
jgi:Predicted nucleotide-binding protein containing TIR-like domain/Aspartyl protease